MRFSTAASLILGSTLTHGMCSRVLSRKTCGAKGLSKQNGGAADQCEWKWQVGLTFEPKNMFPFCGGILLSDEWVLTSATCVLRPRFWVVAGDWKPEHDSSKKQKVMTEVAYQHPRFDYYHMQWDFAMVKLSSPMNMSGCVGTVCLPSKDDAIKPGSTCWIPGWGTLINTNKPSDVLQEAEVKITSDSDCAKKWDGSQDGIIYDESMICARGACGSMTDACQSDTGGPLVCEQGGSWYLHGATSWLGIWARVTAARSWIDDVMSGTYTTTTTPPPGEVKCPSWSHQAWSEDKHCWCQGEQKCSVSGGSNWDCPTKWGPGKSRGQYFWASCTKCKCYSI